MLQFGMPTLIELDDLKDAMKLCNELGLSFVELNMNLPQYQTGCLEDTGYLELMKEKYQIGYTIHLDENLNISDFNRSVAEAYTDTVVRTIRAARILEVPILNMHMNHGVHFTLPDRKVQLFEQYFEDYMESWRSFRKICEEELESSDLKICIENTDGYRGYERAAIEYLLQSDAFGLTWDIGHSHSAGNIDEAFLMSHADRLCHFHIHDGLGERDHMTLGTGEIDLVQRLGTAEKCQCRCVVETKTVEALKASVSWLKNNKVVRF